MNRFLRKRGAGKTEYVLAVVLICAAAITVVGLYGDNIRQVFSSSDNALAGSEDAVANATQSSGQEHGGTGGNTASGGQAVTSTGDRASDSSGLAFKGNVGIANHDKKTIKHAGEEDTPGGRETTISYQVESLTHDGAIKQLVGDDKNGIGLGTYHTSVSVHAGYQDGNIKAGGEAGAEFNVLEGNLTGVVGDENEAYGKGTASVKVGQAKANVKAELVAGKDGLSAQGEAGAELNAVEGTVSAEGGFRIPFTNWVVSAGVSATGSVGVGAKASGHVDAGKNGFSIGGSAKLVAGLGGALGFNFGIRRAN